MSESVATTPLRCLDAYAVRRWIERQAADGQAPWLHQEVARRMADRLQGIRLQPALVLDWWAGLGGSADLLAQAYPQARHVGVVPDAAWLGRVRAGQTSPWWMPARWRGVSERAFVDTDVAIPPAQMVWSNMMLHAVADPVALIGRWCQLLETGGFLMFSCMGPGSVRELSGLYRRLGWAVPTVDFVDMHDLGDMLVRAGFADPVMDQELLTLTWETPEALLKELRSVGCNAHPARFPALRTPNWLNRLKKELEHLRGTDGRLQLSFEVSYGHAFKGPARLKVDTEVRLSVDELRAMVKRSGPAR